VLITIHRSSQRCTPLHSEPTLTPPTNTAGKKNSTKQSQKGAISYLLLFILLLFRKVQRLQDFSVFEAKKTKSAKYYDNNVFKALI